MEVYVVTCSVNECEECGDEKHIVGIFTNRQSAEDAMERHKQFEHFHSAYIYINKFILDEYVKYCIE